MSDVDHEIQDQFILWLDQLNISLSNSQLDMFAQYSQMLIEWNKKINLTSIDDISGIYVKHFYDSLNMARMFLNERLDFDLLDLGTGAGFPGIPMKIVFPDLKLTLCDSLQKRIIFLRHVVDQLQLNRVEIIHDRGEVLARNTEYHEHFSNVVSRAVAKFPVLLELAFPLLKINGHFFAMKGPSADFEWNEAKRAIDVFYAKLIDKFSYSLPNELGQRVIYDIIKLKFTSSQFPRRPGEANRNPII